MSERENVIRRIEREDAIRRIKTVLQLTHTKSLTVTIPRYTAELVVSMLEEQEAKIGHWIDTTNTIGFPRCECSECNSEAGAIWMKYCPNCGAEMKGETEIEID